MHERDADVVPVPDVRDAEPVEPAETLAHGHQVGERLARMLLVREAVDHGDRGVLGELVHVGLREGSDHDRVQVARQDVGRVADRLAPPELEVGCREMERRAAELGHSDLERDARPGRRLLEDQPDGAAGEEVGRLALGARRLQLVGEVEDLLELIASPRPDRREIPALEACRHGVDPTRHATLMVIH